MTIIFTNADFWIESHITPRTSTPGPGTKSEVINLDKGGRIVGWVGFWYDGTTIPVADFPDFMTICMTEGSTVLGYGLEVTQIRMVTANNSASARNIGHNLLIFLRK